ENIIGNNIDRTIYVDVHGTGKRIFAYCEKKYNKVPHCFLLSATYSKYSKFPSFCKSFWKKDKLTSLVFNARGSPCESLNYDKIGTLQNYTNYGPIRDKLEYNIDLITPYHDCINY